ncbi:MAG: tetratricopeptide repeat protein [Spirochaetales bacterium]|nr:tetratricopeptide repeat protein [Spirochaetales bacterium]
MPRRTGSLVSLFFLVLTFGVFAQGDENLYEAGRKAFADGLHLMAARSFRQLVEQYPDSPWADDAEYLRALAHYYLGESPASVEILSGFARRHPRSPHNCRVSYWLAVAYLQQERFREARESLRAQIEGCPEEGELLEQSLLLEGMAEERLELWREARGSYARLLARSSARRLWPEALYRLGGVELRLESYDAALAAFTRVLVEFPESEWAEQAVFYAAEAHYFLGRHGEAERRYLTVLAGSPSLEERETCLYRLARIRGSGDRPAEALEVLRELEASFPRSRYREELAVLEGDLLFDLGRYGEAYARYREALDRGAVLRGGTPGDATPGDGTPGAAGGQERHRRERQVLLFNLGLSAVLDGRPERALDALREAASGSDQAIAEESALRLGMALADLGRDAQAVETLESFARRFPASARNLSALRLLGSLYARQGQHLAAADAYERLLALDPFAAGRDELLYRRGISLLAAGRENEALKALFAVAEMPASGFKAESLYNIGFIYSRRGEFGRAQGYFEELMGLSPPSELAARTVLAAGTCAFNAGEFESALAWFLRNTGGAEGSPWKGDSWLYLGRTYYRLDRLREAAGAFAQAARALDGSLKGEESLFWEGLSLFRLNDLEEAQRVFRRLAERYPEGRRTAEAWYRSATCGAQAGRYEESLEELARARERLGPRTEDYTRSLEREILFQRGANLLRLGRREQAEREFAELARLYPGATLAAEGYFALAEEDFQKGDYRRALRGFLAVQERFPERQAALGALYWAGVSAVRAGTPEQGLELLLRYLESSPEGGLARAAEQEIREVFAAVPQGGDSRVLERFYRRADSSSSLEEQLKNQIRYEYAAFLFPSDRRQAVDLLERIRSSSPREPLASQVSLLLGEHHRLSGELQRALDIFRGITGASTQESAAAAQLAVGRVLEEQAQRGEASFEEAADEYLKTYFVYPDFSQAAQEGLYRAGRVFWEQGKRDRGRRLFDKLAAEFPDSPWLDELPAP